MNEAPDADADALATRESIEREKADLGVPSDPEIEPKEETPEAPIIVEEVVPEKEDEPEAEPEEVEAKLPLTPEEGKALKQYKAELKSELEADFNKKIEDMRTEFGKAKPNEEKAETLEDDVKELAKKLNFDEDKTRAIIEVARKGMGTTLSAEDKAILDTFKASSLENEQRQIFQTEWNGVLPSLKEQFPNATDEQLSKAQAKMDELSHNEDYHDKDMDYIIFKEKTEFDKLLFSPKQKTFESRNGVAPVQDEVADLEEFNPTWSPAQVEIWEKKRQNIMDSNGHEPLHIITSDDRGRTVERSE